MDGAGGFLTAARIAMEVGKKKNPWKDTRLEDEPEEGGQPGQAGGGAAIGGDPSQGYYNTTPPAGGEPPMSPSGHSYYTNEEMEEWEAAGRPQSHDYLRPGPGQIDGTGFGTRGRGDGGLGGWGR